MTSEEFAMIQRWQSSSESHPDLAIYGLGFAVDDLTECAKTREGVQIIRANVKMIIEAKNKLDDMLFDLGLFSVAAE